MRRPADQNAATSGGHASAPTMSDASDGSSWRGMPDRIDAGMCACVIRRSARNAASSSPAGEPFGSTRQAPDSSAMHSSATDTSKLGDTSCETRPPGPAPSRTR